MKRWKITVGVVLTILLASSIVLIAQNKTTKKETDVAEVQDLKVIKETKDSRGYTIREVQYKEGGFLVTKTIVLPPFPGLDERIPVKADTLIQDSLMILVDKTNYLLAVVYRRKRIRQYRAGFGPDRLQDKMMMGDRCTPEGWFKVVSKRNHNVWQKFILLDYPNNASYKKFNERKAKKEIPSDAAIGYAIGIHGTFTGGEKLIDTGIGWTDGCVALKPKDIVDLYKFIEPGTRVYVRR